ncbi:MAG: hypothetical protein JNM50_11990 [Chromatiales bacterium]|jgi:hypothetical protein|nr:hypothetical protein [Chromatiales bacterium]
MSTSLRRRVRKLEAVAGPREVTWGMLVRAAESLEGDGRYSRWLNAEVLAGRLSLDSIRRLFALNGIAIDGPQKVTTPEPAATGPDA